MVLNPINHLKASGQFVLVGDSQQLRPKSQSMTADEEGLGLSVIMRLEHTPGFEPAQITLTVCYRMHPRIMQFPNERFYGCRLKPDESVQTLRRPGGFQWPGQSHVVFVQCRGEESLTGRGLTNEHQARLVSEVAKRILSAGDIPPSELAVIT